jgi:hypothetical protein
MTVPPDDPTAPIELARFSADGRALSEEDFGARHGMAFLLQQGNLDPTRKPLAPQATMVIHKGFLPDGAPAPRGSSSSSDDVSKLRVYPVKHTGRSPFPRMVTVGRTKNNDIVLADISISKFHAFFKEEGGQFFLADGDSRNGTFVDNERALSTKQGKPTALKSGMRVKFGAVEFRFIDLKELLVLVHQFR